MALLWRRGSVNQKVKASRRCCPPAPRARLAVEHLESRHVLSTFTVLNTADSGAGSLRQAILDANASPGLDSIAFNIPGAAAHTITPTSALPAVADPVVIDGGSQPGFAVGKPVIELNGSGFVALAVNGLTITGGNSTIRALVINRFSGSGIFISTLGGNIIEGNFIGTDVNGTAPLGNSGHGVSILNSPNNTIGGSAAGTRNLISSNGVSVNEAGVAISGALSAGNQVTGNFIGTDLTGAAALGNAGAGVALDGGARNSIIGGVTAASRNVISGNNGLSAISIVDLDTTGNVVQGNYIGVTATGDAALGNFGTGVAIVRSSDNVIGGTAAGARNVISANNIGVAITADVLIPPNQSRRNVVQGNFIGTSADGATALGNTFAGVEINTSSENTIGGTTTAARNIISGNGSFGVVIQGTESTGNLVQGNFVGTNATGAAALGNNDAGVRIADNAHDNTIGGTPPGAGNLISGNGFGVSLTGSATNNLVQGNLIGTNAAGDAAVANSRGINVTGGANGNTIGGTAAGARNIISGNTDFGVNFVGAGTTDNILRGNFIGTNLAGTGGLPNHGEGVLIAAEANGNIVGGTAAGAGNLISGNSDPSGANGLSLASNNNVVQGNLIGLDASGNAALANFGFGVDIRDGSQNNLIGGTVPGAGNRIAFNGEGGVRVRGAASMTSNAIRGNSIFSNVGLGINITQPNPVQNPPVITMATQIGTSITIQGTLQSTPSTTFALEFFANPAADPTEGRTFIGTADTTTDNTGQATFNINFANTIPSIEFLTATATDAANNTTAFSAAAQVLVGIAKTATQTVLSALPSPSVFGQLVTLHAVVTPSNPVANVPTGLVSFFLGANPVGTMPLGPPAAPNLAPSTDLAIPNLLPGNYPITAVYAGDANFTGSTSVVAALTVNPADTTTTLASSRNPAASGEAVAFTATVNAVAPGAGVPGGTVTFTIDGVAQLPLGVTNAGQATLITAGQGNGSHIIGASYSGDAKFKASAANAITQVMGSTGQSFIAQVYQDLLHRAAEAQGIDFWNGLLNRGLSRTQVAQGIAATLESRTTQVQSLYLELLHRAADPLGLNTLVALLGAGGTLDHARASILGSAEYTQSRGGGTNAGWLAALYQDVFGRPIDVLGQTTFNLALARGASRAEVALTVLSSAEARHDLVLGYYRTLLRRDADPAGLSHFETILLSQSELLVAAIIIGSDEYGARP